MPVTTSNTTTVSATFQGAATSSATIYRGTALDVVLTLFDADGTTEADLTGWTSLTMEVRYSATSKADPIIQKTLTSGDFTEAPGTGVEHASFSLTDTETNVFMKGAATGAYLLTVHGISPDGRVVWATGTINFADDGTGTGTPAPNPELYYTSSEVDGKINLQVAEKLAGDAVIWKANGDVTAYNAASDTNAARGTAAVTANAAMGAGDRMFLRGLTFDLDRALVFSGAGQSLEGENNTTITAAYTGASNACLIAAGFAGSGYTGITNFTVRNLTFNVPTGFYNGLAVAHGTDILLENLRSTLGSGGSVFHGLDLMGCKRVTVKGVHMSSASDYGLVQVDTCTSGAATYWNGTAAVGVNADSTACQYVILEDLHLTSTANNAKMVHIHRQGHKDIHIRDINADGGLGCIVDDTDSQLDGLTVSGGVWRTTKAGTGVSLHGTTSNRITGVHVSGFRVVGPAQLLYAAFPDGMVVQGCNLSCTSTTKIGIQVASGGGRSQIIGCRLENTNGGGTSTGAAIQTDSGTDGVSILGGDLEGWGTGIKGDGTNVHRAGVRYTDCGTNTSGTGITTGIATAEVG